MGVDYVDLKIDTERHAGGAAVAKQLRGERGGGIPWIVITDADGIEIVTGDRPSERGPSNIGCPVTEPERAWFVEMLRRSRQRMTDGQLATVEASLAAYAKAMGR